MAGRSKGLEKFDRNGVVQHRNHVCEIALRKTINTFHKEGKILEKELREISKVRETLRQIRAPLRRKVFEASLSDQDEKNDHERKSGPQSLRCRKISTNATTNVRTFEAGNGDETVNTQRKLNTNNEHERVYRSNTSLSSSSARRREAVSQNSVRKVSNRQPKQSVCLLQAPKPEALENVKLRRRKISAPAHLGVLSSNAPRVSSQTSFLPPISPNNSGNSPRSTRRTPEVISTCGSDDEDDRKANPRSVGGPSRAESLRYARDMPLTSVSRGRGIIDPEEEKSLTMEETLRIKGKFRQIGHSIIATALLKGLRQKGQLTSEAIHNLHKPVSVNSEQKKQKKVENDDEDETENEIKESSEKLSKFRAVARKTINVNRFIGPQSGRGRSQSDPSDKNTESYQVGTKNEQLKSATQSAVDQGKAGSDSRRNSEERSEVADEKEEEARDSVKIAVGNPLMNAHIARRRKISIAAQAFTPSDFLARARSAASSADVSRDQAHNGDDDLVMAEKRVARNSRISIGSAGLKAQTENQERGGGLDSKQALNAGSDGSGKTVRFKLEAW